MAFKILGNTTRGSLFIVSAPAGTGKTTLVAKLIEEFPCVIQSVSFTTRLPREGEIDGVHYFFICKEEFEDRIRKKEFLEHVTLYGEYYGTSRTWVEQHLDSGKHVVLVIDTQGALELKQTLAVKAIFIMPPSYEELKRRLTKRKTEPSDVIEERLCLAKKEMERSRHYDYLIVNDDINLAYDVLRSIFIAEEHALIPK